MQALFTFGRNPGKRLLQRQLHAQTASSVHRDAALAPTGVCLETVEHRLSAEPLPIVALALALPTGSRWAQDAQGASAAFYKHALLASPAGREMSRLAWCREAQLRGSPLGVTLTRQTLILDTQLHVRFLPEVLATLSGLLEANPAAMDQWQLESEVSARVQLDWEMAQDCQLSVLWDAAYAAAFRSQGLGNPLHPSATDIDFADIRTGMEGLHSRVRLADSEGPRLLVSMNDASTTLKHDDLVAAVRKHFAMHSSTPSRASVDKTAYIGGEARLGNLQRQGALLAFPLESAEETERLVFKALLAKVLASEDVSLLQQDSHLLGLFVKDPQRLASAIGKLKDLGSITDAQMAAARVKAALDYSVAVDSRRGRLLFRIERQLPGDFGAVRAEQMTRMAAAMLSVPRPTLVVEGNIRHLPHLDGLWKPQQ